MVINNNKKQTATQWFIEQLPIRIKNAYAEEITNTLNMEQTQIIEAYDEGYEVRDDMGSLSSNPNGKDYFYTNFR